MAANKISNEYQAALKNYEQIPKAVLAAIAVSFASCGGDNIEEAQDAIMDEWKALFNAGIVPQKPKS